MIVFLWKHDNSIYFLVVGQTLWVVLIAYGCSFLGALQVPAFAATLIYALVGIIYDFKDRAQNVPNAEKVSIFHKIINFLDVQSFYNIAYTPVSTPCVQPTTNASNENNVADTISKENLNLDLSTDVQSSRSSFVTSNNDTVPKSQSGIYFKALFLACFATMLYKHVWMLIVAVIPISIYLANKFIIAFCLKDIATQKFIELTLVFKEWIVVRHTAVLPVCLPGVLRLNRKVHKFVRRSLQDSIDTASSIIMIILLILTVTFAGIFCAVEIYSETITVVQLGNDVVNWTLYHQPELMKMFPEGM